MTTNFDHSVLSSYDNLKNFFTSSDAPQRITLRNSLPISKAIIPLNPNLHGIWQVGQLVTADFRMLTAITLRTIARIFSLVDAKGIAKQIKISSQYIMGGFAMFSDNPTHVFFLQKTQNHSNDRGVVSLAPSIEASRITDERVRNRLLPHRLEQVQNIHFNRPRGICLGIVEWFLFLYFRTKQQFSDPRKHMIALGKEFSKGGDKEAVLLQNLNLGDGELLNMRIGIQEGQLDGEIGRPLYAHLLETWENEVDQVTELIRFFPPGAYEIRVPFHVLAYIKIDEHLSFLLNPNRGIIEINGEDVPRNLHCQLHAITREILQDVEWQNPSHYERYRNEFRSIEFFPVRS